MIHVILYSVVALLAVSALIVVGQVGKPKKPTTPGVAAGSVAINAIVIVGLVYVALHV